MKNVLFTRLVVTLIILASFLTVFLAILIGNKLGIAVSDLHDGEKLFEPAVIVTTLLLLLLPIAPIIFSSTLFNGVSFSKFGFRHFLPKQFLFFFFSGFLLEFAARIASLLIAPNSHTSFAVSNSTPISLWVLYYVWFLFLMLLNSITEELVYRAYPIESLLKVADKPYLALFFSAILFSLVHFLAEPPTISGFVYRAAFGVLAGLVYFVHRTIWPIIALHTGLNIMANGFSDSDWKTGGIVRLEGVSGEIKSWTSFAALSLAAYLYYRFLVRKPKSMKVTAPETCL